MGQEIFFCCQLTQMMHFTLVGIRSIVYVHYPKNEQYGYF